MWQISQSMLGSWELRQGIHFPKAWLHVMDREVEEKVKLTLGQVDEQVEQTTLSIPITVKNDQVQYAWFHC